ncbi:hypothetical protein A2382_00740 [Candidatus Woesebacteria bacterium RIFOXYB1_FULL_38_16]|uniref:F5/8 type C domain-containing protein n=1 Tax=Candidatus Woesebacteria bacterium RIFOXYB1_FULL_38_16 TaxID=1802538 RepID=A0A1F8CSI3_9BACT|nr:MAG: hypothetical protein A2382_00740 [Candidatus Woesebacteria bacterium RIFOXYB1_FULL_38_16]
MLRKLFKLIKRHYLIFLFFTVVVSYGQLLLMDVWQDDHAIFFKLAHINERAGFLGDGIFGAGAYRYTAAPYYLIYLLVGYRLPFYFLLAWICYFVSVYVIFKLGSRMFGQRAGRVSAFLYGAGYVASDGFIRLYNSVITSVSVIGIAFLFFFLWQAFQTKKIRYYLGVIISYYLVNELASARSHYLIGVLLLFEVIFNFSLKRSWRQIFWVLVRISIYFVIFYRMFIVGMDQRAGSIGPLIIDLAKGKLYLLKGFLGSVSNFFVNDWLFEMGVKTMNKFNLWYLLPLVLVLMVVFLRRKTKKWLLWSGLFLGFLILLLWMVDGIFNSPEVGYSSTLEKVRVYLGGVILTSVCLTAIFYYRQGKKVVLFLIGWILLNIAAYWVYAPGVVYGTINRYFAHSFFALSLLGGWLFVDFSKKKDKWYRLMLLIIVGWGFLNLINSVVYQRWVVVNRAYPARDFYQQLKTSVSEIKKGDVFYFDVGKGKERSFTDAFSVAQMPEETAIAWRFGVDRYDLKRFTNFEELNKFVKSSGLDSSQIHTFYYGEDGLINTSDVLSNYFERDIKRQDMGMFDENKKGVFFEDVSSVYPLAVITRLGVLLDKSRIVAKGDCADLALVESAFEYKQMKKIYYMSVKVKTNNEWRERITKNILDDNYNTAWQANRVLWADEGGIIELDLGKINSISGVNWVNAFSNNTPVEYSYFVSTDGVAWVEIYKEDKIQRRSDKEMVEDRFDKAVSARFIKMKIGKTLSKDAPAIAEIWPVFEEFSGYKTNEFERFLMMPFEGVCSTEDLERRLALSDNMVNIDVQWCFEDGLCNDTVITANTQKVFEYRFRISPHATKLRSLVFGCRSVACDISVKSVSIEPWYDD